MKTNERTQATGILVKPKTIQLSSTGTITDPNSSYSYYILDNTYATFSTETSMLAGRSVSISDVPASQGVYIVATGTELSQGTTATTKLIISGNQTGARIVIPIKVTQALNI